MIIIIIIFIYNFYNLLFSLTLLYLSVIVGFLFFVNAYDEKCMMEE